MLSALCPSLNVGLKGAMKTKWKFGSLKTLLCLNDTAASHTNNLGIDAKQMERWPPTSHFLTES